MNLPEEVPSLPKLPFIVGDGVLIVAAVFIAMNSEFPLGTVPLLVIAACVIVGAGLVALPFVVDYNRRQDVLLTERENVMESLTRTLAASSEQLGIAAASLPASAEATAKSLKLAEQLPARIQDKLNLIKEQMAEAENGELEALQQEVATLRSVESERLETAAEKLVGLTRELAGLEATARAALEELTKRLEAATEAPALERPVVTEADEGTIDSPVRKAGGAPRQSAAKRKARGEWEAEVVAVVDVVETQVEPEGLAEPGVATEPEVAVEPEAVAETVAETEWDAKPGAERAAESDAESDEVLGVESEVDSEVEADSAVVPEPGKVEAGEAKAETEHAAEGEREGSAEKPAAVKPVRRKGRREGDPTPGLFDGPDFVEADEGEPMRVSATEDGKTRLIVTAYIGIGNKLYVRGDGPGLHAGRGTPLQFVSIGKWRWETEGVEEPLRVRILKNDELECTGLGEVELVPGKQHEVKANF